MPHPTLQISGKAVFAIDPLSVDRNTPGRQQGKEEGGKGLTAAACSFYGDYPRILAGSTQISNVPCHSTTGVGEAFKLHSCSLCQGVI